MAIHKSWKVGEVSLLELFFDGEYQEYLAEALREAGLWDRPDLVAWPGRPEGIFGAEAMEVVLGTTDGHHPEFMAALRAAARKCCEKGRGGFAWEGW